MNRVTGSIGQLSGHYVICAYGRVGRAVLEELQRRNYTLVVIESKPELELLLAEHGVRYISGDPADESVLRQAGIERARGLICAVDSDAANVFITLTARALNPDLRIVARASERASIDKLVRASADEVVSPYGLTGRRMAVLAVQPSAAGSARSAQPRLGHPAQGGRRPCRNSPRRHDHRRGPRTLCRGGHPRVEEARKRGLGEPGP